MNFRAPQVLGLRKSFGFGDRLGLATPGHIDAVAKTDFGPVFAQQSIREMTRTDRTPDEVMRAAQQALSSAGWDRPWGADADHLKTPQDVERTAAAGFTFFTIDPSEFVEDAADHLSEVELDARTLDLVAGGVLPADWLGLYAGKTFDVGDGLTLRLDETTLKRAAVKYGRALQHCDTMAQAIGQACAGRPCEIELSVDETATPTRPEEHLFVGLELRRRNVRVVSLAPRFPGEFEKGIDYRGDLKNFEAQLRRHVAVAAFCGPYKLSIHSGSDKFSIYPIIGRVCGDLLHVKTAGTSYLEALRVLTGVASDLFGEIAAFARGRFTTDRASYHISTTDADIAALGTASGVDAGERYLNTRAGRQLLHVTFGSVLTSGKTSRGRPFKDALCEVLERHADLHRELLARHLGQHLSLLTAG